MSLPRFGVQKPVPVNLLMMAAIVAGVVAAFTIRREFFPETAPEQAMITLLYPGATPQEIEESMARKVEDAVAELSEVDRLVTTLSEGGGGIMVEFREGTDIDKAVDKVQNAVDQLQDLPAEAERIRVTEFEPNVPAIMVTIFGNADEEILKRAIRVARDDLKSLPGMGSVVISGVRGYELRVDVKPDALLEHGISLPQVADAIQAWMNEVPGGVVRTQVGNINVRTLGVTERADEIRRIVVKAQPSGQALRVADMASVRESFVDTQVERRFNGHAAVSLTVFKTGEQDAVKIAEMTRAYVAGRRGDAFIATVGDKVLEAMNDLRRKRNPSAPPLRTNRKVAYDRGLATSAAQPVPGEIATHSDLARFIEGRLDLLSRNALQGAVLVFLTLLLFLNWRAAFWVMTGLVTAVCGTMIMMSVLGITLNLLTMFGLIMVLGMLVDDAVVVAENIQSRHDRGEPSLQAAIRGAEQVAWPVVGTVTTTIVAFLPLTFIHGRIGDLLGALPFVVACALTVSLTEALLILPSHMGHSLVKRDRSRPGAVVGALRRFEHWRDRLIGQRVLPAYERLMRTLLEYRYITCAATLGVFIVSVGMFAGGRLGFVFLESADAETLIVEVRMPIGTPLAETERIAARIEEAARAQPETKSVSAVVGQRANIDLGIADAAATHLAQLFIELLPVEQRSRNSAGVIAAMREHHGELEGVENLRYSEIGGGPSGPDITVQVTGDDAASVAAAVARVKQALAQRQGVYDIADDAYDTQRELQIALKPAAASLGLNSAEVARQVRGALFGLEAHTFSERQEDIDVRVRLDETARHELSTIDQMWVIAPPATEVPANRQPGAAGRANGFGRPVPLREVADVIESTSFSTVRRIDRQRAVTITADTAPEVSPEAVIEVVAPEFENVRRQFPSVGITLAGRQRDLQRAMSSLPMGIGAALLMIYVILAWLFSSYLQPVVVMLAIPFGLIGVVWGHMAFGYNATFLSLIGFIALCGIVVNNSLILVEFFNTARSQGTSLRDALVQAGRQRLRPILLTTITTFLGLTPLMLVRSFQARFLIPMAISISFGLITSAVLVLTTLPCFMVVLDDLKAGAYYLWFGLPRSAPRTGPRPEASPAGDTE